MSGAAGSGRILVVGALSIGYVRDHWVEPMREALDAVFVDVSLLRDAYRGDFHEKYLYRLIRDGGFDTLFFYSDAVQRDFSDDFFDNVRAAGLRVVAFHADDDPEVWYAQNEVHDHRYDLILSPSTRGVARRRAKGVGERVRYLPWGFNPRRFPALCGEPPEALYDVVFVGTNLSHQENAELYCRDGWGRQKILVDLHAICQRLGLRFKVFGFGWERHPVLCDCYGGFLSHDEMVKVYRHARVVFNPGLTADDDFTWQTKLRHFEVAGLGCCQVVNENPELADLFREGKEILFYRDASELEERLAYVVEHEEAWRAIAAAAARRAHHEHTTAHRLAEIFGERASTERRALHPVIRVIELADRDALRQLFSRIERGEERFDGVTAVQLVAGVVTGYHLEHTQLPQDWERWPVDGWGVRGYFQLAALHGNTVQRKRQDIHGVAFGERVEVGRFDPSLRRRLRRDVVWIEDERWAYPLCNRLVRPAALPALLKAYLEEDVAGLRALRIEDTGRVVGDFRLPSRPGDAMPEPRYLSLVRELTSHAVRRGERMLVYAARGEMVDQLIALLRREGLDGALIGFVDRSLAGGEVAGLPVYPAEAIERLLPEYLLIAAETSGPAIYRGLGHLQARVTLLPLFDPYDPVWQVVLS
ncbi:glycosyltransferase family protein [Endothiovibrio diazotrophicus]